MSKSLKVPMKKPEKYVVKYFDKSFLMGELDLPWSALKDDISCQTRWSVIHDIVFEVEGTYYSASYSVGATECQDESPWEYDDKVKCTLVEKREVTVTKFMPVEANSTNNP